MRNSTPLKASKTGVTINLRKGKSQIRLNLVKLLTTVHMVMDDRGHSNSIKQFIFYEEFAFSRFSRVHFYRQRNHGIEGNQQQQPIRDRVSLETNMAADWLCYHTEGLLSS